MNKCCGEKLAAFGTAIAIQIANGLNADETNILGALFTVIGDQLSLIAAAEASGNSDNNNSSNTKSTGTAKSNETSKSNESTKSTETAKSSVTAKSNAAANTSNRAVRR